MRQFCSGGRQGGVGGGIEGLGLGWRGSVGGISERFPFPADDNVPLDWYGQIKGQSFYVRAMVRNALHYLLTVASLTPNDCAIEYPINSLSLGQIQVNIRMIIQEADLECSHAMPLFIRFGFIGLITDGHFQ